MRTVGAISVSFFVMLLIALTLLVGVGEISDESIKENARSSASVLCLEGERPKILNNPLWKLDNFTDSWMLNITCFSDSTSAFQRALQNPYWDSEELSKVEILKEATETGSPSHGVRSSYGRYWHGYQITLKPLLLLADYKGIRIANSVIIILLIICVAIGCWRRLPKIYFWAFLLTCCIFYFPAVLFSLQFSSCFIISLTCLIVILYGRNLIDNYSNVCVIFFIAGALTSFFDLLTTPLVTLGFPLIIYGGLRKGLSLKKTIQLSICWGVGYLMFWVSKWILASCFTDSDIISNALEQIVYRSVGTIENSDNLIRKVLNPLLLFLLIIGPLCYYFVERKYRLHKALINAINSNVYLLIIAYYPLLWFLVFNNHSIVHIWFTYRSWSITVFSLILFGSNVFRGRTLTNARI